LESNQALEPLLRGAPVEAMEAAKQIIGEKLVVDPASLEAILSNRKSPKWSRIAAIYSLGFLGERLAVPALLKILSDHKEAIAVRAHAAEALGNIGAAEVVPALAEILKHESSPSLRKS
jgi:HEAT repeat protein